MNDRELAIKIVTDVMRWHKWEFENEDYFSEYPMFYFDDSGGGIYVHLDFDDPGRFFDPVNDITAGWAVVEKMEELGYGIVIWSVVPSSDPIVYIVHFGDARKKVTEFTLPKAICLAALKAGGTND